MNTVGVMNMWGFEILFGLQGVWGLFMILLTWSARRVLRDIEENTQETRRVAESVNGLNLLLAGNYVGRTEMNETHARLRSAEGEIIALKARDDLVRQMVTSRRRTGDSE